LPEQSREHLALADPGDVQHVLIDDEIDQYMTSLPPGTFANLLQLRDAFTADTAEERFEFGLDTLLRGLAAPDSQT
jgi:hypothetical protein